jgi:DeoR family glycerol-3-phosphate regulon repressor
MIAEHRREAILELARERSELSVEDMARRFGVSRETVRRDLSALQSQGLLRRVHGGAMPTQISREPAFQDRLVSNPEGKKRIARAAASLFLENDTLMIDTGSTTEAFAVELAQAPKLTVITNSHRVASRISSGPRRHPIYMIGGAYRPDTEQTLGSATLEQIGRYHADHAVLGCGAIDASGGLMDFDFEEAMVARAMIRQSRSLTIVADHSKFDRVAVAKICDLAEVDRIVTDAPLPAALREVMAANEIEIIVASGDGK